METGMYVSPSAPPELVTMNRHGWDGIQCPCYCMRSHSHPACFTFVLFTFAPRMSEAASTIICGHRLYWLIGGL